MPIINMFKDLKEEMNKCLNENQENRKKLLNGIIKTIQDTTVEVNKKISKDNPNWNKTWKEITQEVRQKISFTSRLNKIEERNSGFEEKVEEMNNAAKESVKTTNPGTMSPGKLDTMKRSNLWIR